MHQYKEVMAAIANNDTASLLQLSIKTDGLNKPDPLMLEDFDAALELALCDPPAIIAAEHGHVEALKVLIEAGIDINQANNQGETPAFIAARNGYGGVLQLLIQHGANLRTPNVLGATPAFAAAGAGQVDALKLLIAQQVNLEEQNLLSETPIYNAASSGHEKVIELLIEQNVDINKPNRDGFTPVFIAVFYRHEEALKALAKGGADLNKTNKFGTSPALYAITSNSEALFKLLVGYGANLNSPKKDDKTPAELAIQKGYLLEDPHPLVPEPKDNNPEKMQSAASFNQSIFSAETNKEVCIEVEWNGALLTSTREYTRISLFHESRCIAEFHVNNSRANSDIKTSLGVSESVFTKAGRLNVNVRIDYLKCSIRDTMYVRSSSGEFKHSPRYIGDGKYEFNISSSELSQAGQQTCRLVINNKTIGEDVCIEADLGRVERATNNEHLGVTEEIEEVDCSIS